MRPALPLVLAAGVLSSCAVGPHVPAAGRRDPGRDARRDRPRPGRLARRPGLVGRLPGRRPAVAHRRGAANGFDVRLAAWRVEEARALAGITRAQLFPQLQASAGWSRSRALAVHQPEPSAPGQPLRRQPRAVVGARPVGPDPALDQAALAQYLATEEARRGVDALARRRGRDGLLRAPRARPPARDRRSAPRRRFGRPATCSTAGSPAGPRRRSRPRAPRRRSPRPRPTSRTSSGRSRRRRTSSTSCSGASPARSRAAPPSTTSSCRRRSRRACRRTSWSGAPTCARRSSTSSPPTPRSAWRPRTSSRRSP